MSEYLIVLLLSFLPTFLLSFHPNSETKGKQKTIYFSILIVAIWWIFWDFFATYRGHWSFNGDKVLGFYIFNLPIEEILFFILIPYSCLYLWLVIKNWTNFQDFKKKLQNK
jgi:lycopene cyclase domain-containing protein